jgi:serine/threonine-protein kinase
MVKTEISHRTVSYHGSRRTVEDQLNRILANKLFAQSARMSRFLRFTVERTLDGKSEELKEYLIGVEVFDRKPSYDPRVDPIVRVEARRLRSKLRSYYESDGSADELVIDLPKGAYAPLLRARASVQPAPPPRPGAIAVLPFSNLSPEPDTEYFSDGLTEELIHRLTKVDGMMVVAWNSAAKLKGPRYDVREIGRQLNVSAVLVGSVRGCPERIRVTVQLIDTSTARYLWSETYDRNIEHLFVIQEEISTAIVKTLAIKLVDRAPVQPDQKPAHNLDNLYLKGRYHWNKRTSDGLSRSAQFFHQSIAADPESALGYAGLADAYTLLAEYGLASPTEFMPAAKSAARKALEIDPTLSEAHASLGLIYSVYDWEWAEAGEHFRKAMEFNPGYATAHHWYAVDYLCMLGRFDEAMEEIEIAQQLDPLSPIIREGKGSLLMFMGRYDEAIEEHRQTLELDRYFYKGFTSMGRAYLQKGQYDQAIAMLQKGWSLSGDIPSILGALGQAYALAGRHADARRMLAELTELSRRRHVPGTCPAIISIGLGETERALDLLEAACENRDKLATLKVHPVYDGLRSEPRFQALLRKVGFGPPKEAPAPALL